MRKRVLIVEDIPLVRKNLCSILELQDFEVKVAASAEEALNLVHCVTFHVICIDIALDDNDPTNTDGQKVLAEVARLAEGTRALIVSGNRDQHLAIEAYERYGLARYLLKGQFSIDDFAAAVAKEASVAALGVFGHFASAFDALVFELDEPFWVDSAMRAIPIKGGMYTLRRSIEGLVNRLAPIRPHRDANERARIDATNATISFRFWSKARGVAIRCLICRTGTTDIAAGEERHAFGGVEAVVTVDLAAARTDYLE
jgi:ActR/RegA family two-component response regulator